MFLTPLFFFSSSHLKESSSAVTMIKMQGVDPVSVSESFDDVGTLPSARKEGLTDRFRQKLGAAGKRVQGNQQTQGSDPDLSNLTERSQVRYTKTREIHYEKSAPRSSSYVPLKP